jgi:hypothetical protein
MVDKYNLSLGSNIAQLLLAHFMFIFLLKYISTLPCLWEFLGFVSKYFILRMTFQRKVKYIIFKISFKYLKEDCTAISFYALFHWYYVLIFGFPLKSRKQKWVDMPVKIVVQGDLWFKKVYITLYKVCWLFIQGSKNNEENLQG